MDENRLDGNAAGGLLGEIFPFEMTTAKVTCTSCGSLWRVGQTMVYGHDMGTIVRCVRQRPYPRRPRTRPLPARHEGCEVLTGRGSVILFCRSA